LRIISGKYKGRNLSGFTIEGTRPTQDRVKESIFSMIQGKIPGATVLDLFAGSGNLGIEALSNLAEYAYFIDNNKVACQTIQKNLTMCNIANAKVYQMDYKKALEHFEKERIQFDIVFLDPPYRHLILDGILKELESKQLLKENAIVVCEFETLQTEEEYTSLTSIKEKKYGSKNIIIYQNQQKE